MDFSFSPQEEQFRNELVEWLAENLPEGWLAGKRVLPEEDKEKAVFLRDWQRTLYEGGWAGIHWPREYGGRGATLMEEVIYQQEMARVKAPPVINFMGINMVGPTLMQMGTDQQKERYIDKILSGTEIWCQGFSEPNAGSDLAAIQTRAVKEGDRWVINGQKVWTTFAHMADKCFLLARTGQPGARHKGLTAFLIDMNQPGVEVRPIYQMNDDHDFNEIFLNDALAYDEDIVGTVDEGWKVAMALLMHERVGVAGTIFHLQDMFDELVQMAKTTIRNGRALIEDSVVQKDLSGFYTRVRAAVLTYYRHLTATIKQGYPGPEGSIDKLVSSELSKEITSYAISLLGPAGTLWRTDAPSAFAWQNQYLQSFGATIAGGTTEIQKNVIGERILGLPKDLKG
ncbi:acyl-CoA dehydrogenase family protein [Pseudobacillus badius]|uniref:acyl-CoA dehydrogenase family protein n=1 Tax=Bacillus badius TaxID=1455 RepID=UPI0007B09806|nr:acyl-CoA dehydrogenase family protein [Bacillus badius]KZN99580.1 acyl-CoA dehydrogenase [Bacillus badius]MED0665900.1 acyl-CoA dehydrogenase family protein [Bacillus badius]OCS85684.1 acyl-CoA dehydrogenase [Bacillus badius]OVE51962.1 acyl-CoA dehydrogenase [Bacillus badius]TDW03398.1 alkylation response protein AidB-like acyl-CoA dehydrogenase [Bacillus badius]